MESHVGFISHTRAMARILEPGDSGTTVQNNFPLVFVKRRCEKFPADGGKMFLFTGGKKLSAAGGKMFSADGGKRFSTTGGKHLFANGGTQFAADGGKHVPHMNFVKAVRR